jgi:hypothetical protein
MSSKVIVHKGRTNVLAVSLGINVSADTITSQIRSEPDQNSTLLASWVVTNKTDGSDGEIILTLDDSITKFITATSGYMDLKRITGGQPVSIFDRPIEVDFRGTVTA